MKKLVIALAITATAALAYAGPQAGGGQGGGRAGHMRKMAAKLGLTDAQKDQIKAIFKADREKNQQLYSDYRAARKARRDQFLSVLTPEQRAQLQAWRAARKQQQ